MSKSNTSGGEQPATAPETHGGGGFPVKRRGGRRSKYTPEVVQALCEAITLGLSQKRACEACGVSTETFRTWMHSRPEFFVATKKAEGEFITRNLATIAAARVKSWQAAAWLLERRFPREFARVETIKAEVRRGEDLDATEVDAHSNAAKIKLLREAMFADVDALEKSGAIVFPTVPTVVLPPPQPPPAPPSPPPVLPDPPASASLN